MKKLVRVSLFVLMALTLSLAIGCKHDSDPEQKSASSNFFAQNANFFFLSYSELSSILTFLNYEISRGVVHFIVPRGISCCNFAVL